MDSAEVLQRESSLAPGTVDAADNVHLERIFRELEEHHIQRFGRAPKLFRRAGEILEIDAGGAAGAGSAVTASSAVLASRRVVSLTGATSALVVSASARTAAVLRSIVVVGCVVADGGWQA